MMKKRTASNFKPSVKPFTKNQRELLQIGLPLVVVILLFMPMCVTDGTNHPYANSNNEADKRYESSSNLIGVNLPYYVPSIAAGNTTYGRGVAWIFNDTLRFKDPVNLVDASVNIGIGNPFFQTLIGADVDLDGYTEFLFMMSNLTNTNLVVVDFDGGGSATEYNYDSIPDPMEIIVGDFNGDTLIDVGVYSKIRLVTKNLSSDTIIGSLTFSTEEIVKACTGDFSIVAGDEIAVMWLTDPWTPMSKVVVDTIFGDCTSINPFPIESATHVDGYDMVSFEYGSDLDNLAVTMFDINGQESVLVGINANLTPRFELRDPKNQGEFYVKKGKFNMDTQDDLVIVSNLRSPVIFVNGIDGRMMKVSQEECVSMSSRGFATDILDSDYLTDVILEGPTGQFALVRGSNGETGYEDPRLPGPFEQVLSYDINNDGRSDAITLYMQINVLLSDTEPPQVTLDPLYPTHPTIYDPYLKVELTATDEVYVKEAKVYIRPADFAVGGYLENDMTEAQNGKFIFFQTDLQAGNYEYYIEVVDPYLNSFSYGNFTNPHIMTVEGHLASGVPYNVTFDEAQRHILALGNDSLGNSRIYSVVSDIELKTTTLRVFSTDFTMLGEFKLTESRTDERFEVYTGMFDGDNVLDPILISSNYTQVKIWAFNGDTFTSWKNTSYDLYPAKPEHGMIIVDDDGDKVDELAYVGENSTGLFLIRADDNFATWTDVALKETTPVVDYVPINMFGSDPQLAILRYDNAVYMYHLKNVTYLKTFNYTSPGATSYDDPISIQVYRNSTHSSDQLLVVYRSWLVDVPTNYVCLVDKNTVNVGDWPSYTFTGQHIRVTLPFDIDDDGVDELSALDASGNASLYELST
ncbi:MAG: hypothetical protein ACFFDD_08760, partial [Promethearchaeota archaeon]